jgi:hypothetical protein
MLFYCPPLVPGKSGSIHSISPKAGMNYVASPILFLYRSCHVKSRHARNLFKHAAKKELRFTTERLLLRSPMPEDVHQISSRHSTTQLAFLADYRENKLNATRNTPSRRVQTSLLCAQATRLYEV